MAVFDGEDADVVRRRSISPIGRSSRLVRLDLRPVVLARRHRQRYPGCTHLSMGGRVMSSVFTSIYARPYPATAGLIALAIALAAQPRQGFGADSVLELRRLPDKADLARLPAGPAPQRIIVKFKEGSGLTASNGHLQSSTGTDAAAVESALDRLGIAPSDLRPLHTRPRSELESERLRAQAASGGALADLTLYYVVSAPSSRAGTFLEQLAGVPGVEFVEPEPIPAPPPVDLAPPTSDLTSQQQYRAAPPLGIGALSFTQPGANGANTRIVDIEYSWVLAHEDLELPAAVNIDPSPAWDPFPSDQGSHGTAVLGELAGKVNGYGIIGIVPMTDVRIAPAATLAYGYNLPRAISLATAALAPGDVILLEQQMSVCGTTSYGPVEWSQSVYDAIATATALGISVVEAAGNGAVNLDGSSWRIPVRPGHAQFPRHNRRRRDTGHA